MSRRLSWVALAVVAAMALAFAAAGDRAPRTEADRVAAIASEVRCPTCRGLSVAESDAKASEAIQTEIVERVRAGQSDGEIRAYLVSRYGPAILLRPESGGVAGLVWALPAAVMVVGVAGLVAAFRRWGRRGREATPADVVLVEQARENLP